MALEFFHGFDNCSGTGELIKYGWAAANITNFSAGRFAGVTKCVSYPSGGAEETGVNRRQYLYLPTPRSRFIVGLTTRVVHANNTTLDALPDIMNRIWKFMDLMAGDTTANVQMGIGIGPGGSLRVWRGTTLVYTSAPGVFLYNVWHRLEFDLTIHSSTGAIAIRVDNVSLTGLSGITNTQATANATAQTFRFNGAGSPSNTVTIDMDDLVIMNDIDDGTGMNTWKGDVRCDLLVPTGDFQKQFTPNSGTTCYTQIDEPVPSTTDYVDGVAGQEDIYDLTDLSTLSLVHAMQVNSQGYRTGTTFFNHTPKLYTNASNASLSAMVLAGTSGNFKRVCVLNPVTGLAWTPAEINALRLGMPVS